MRIILLYILLALLGQQTTFLESENLKTSESEKSSEPRAMSHETFLETENLKTSKSEKGNEQRAMSNETFLESEESVNISEICGNEKTNHRLVQKKSEKGCEQRAMSYEPFSETEKSVNISEICGNEKTNHKLVQKKSEKGCEQRAMSYEPFSETEKTVNISEICGNEKTNHRLVQKKSEKGCELRAMSNEQRFRKAQSSQHEAQSLKKNVDCCPLTVDYFENQIRLADSLYKNYLPQYNFEEVKAAVMFFDSCEQRAMSNEPFLESENLKTSESEKRLKSQGRNAQNSQLETQSPSQVFNFSDSQIQNNVDHNELLKFQNSKILEFLRARAHYYHAVGLTERDDIVGACEHYFIALEIMETESENLKTSKSGKGSEPRAMSHEQKFRNAHSSKLEVQSPDYEKIRFLSLIYTRLGELFFSENYCDIAISKYRKALKYVLLLGENSFIANTYKCLGHSYQLYNMPDSALYYYNKSLETNHELPNRLDVEKCIARIMFYKGERDSAYSIIRNNLNIIDNYGPKDAYYTLLGEMYYEDKEYDSAVHYLVLSLSVTQYKHTIISSSKRLSSIYNILGDHEKVTYYDRITLSVLDKEQEKNGDVTKLHDVYRRYSDSRRKLEYDTEMAELRNINLNIFISVLIILTILLAINYVIRRKNDKKVMLHDETISAKETEIHKMKEEISVIKKENEILSNELESIKTDFPVITDKNIMEYYNCDICKRILAEIDRVELEQLKINSIPCLSAEDLALIELEANLHLNGYVKHILIKHPELKKQDIHCICLSLLNINEPTIAVLLGRSYNAVWTRMKKIRTTMNINSNADLLHI